MDSNIAGINKLIISGIEVGDVLRVNNNALKVSYEKTAEQASVEFYIPSAPSLIKNSSWGVYLNNNYKTSIYLGYGDIKRISLNQNLTICADTTSGITCGKGIKASGVAKIEADIEGHGGIKVDDGYKVSLVDGVPKSVGAGLKLNSIGVISHDNSKTSGIAGSITSYVGYLGIEMPCVSVDNMGHVYQLSKKVFSVPGKIYKVVEKEVTVAIDRNNSLATKTITFDALLGTTKESIVGIVGVYNAGYGTIKSFYVTSEGKEVAVRIAYEYENPQYIIGGGKVKVAVLIAESIL